MFDGKAIAAGATLKRALNPANGGDADQGAVMDFAIRHAFKQQWHHFSAVSHGFELGRRAQIHKERARGIGVAAWNGLGAVFHAWVDELM